MPGYLYNLYRTRSSWDVTGNRYLRRGSEPALFNALARMAQLRDEEVKAAAIAVLEQSLVGDSSGERLRGEIIQAD